MPGVTSATLASSAPFVTGGNSSPVAIEGREYADEIRPRHTQQRYVLPDYFDVMGMRMIAGRAFNEGDREGAEPVAIVSAAEVRRDFGGASSLDKRIRHQACGGASSASSRM